MIEKLSHDQLAADLASHLRGVSSRITWEDMQLGPSGSPRPDVYAMEPTYTRLTFEAFECKVSVSDFRADVTAGKWQSYLKYANAVTFAVPHGLIAKEMVPAQCGLIVRGPSGRWRYQKKPTRQVLTEIPWQAWIKLLLDGTTRAGQEQKRARWAEYYANEKLAKRYGKDVAQMVHDLQRLPNDFKFAQEQHNLRVDALKQQYEDARKRQGEIRHAEEARCNQALGQLAMALGLPKDTLLSDLQARAGQILRVLGASDWREHPLVGLADRLEKLAKDMRSTGEVLQRRDPTADASSNAPSIPQAMREDLLA